MTTAEIQQLQRDLKTLGFWLVVSDSNNFPNGTLDLATEMALREFQRYAKLRNVAKEGDESSSPHYGERLSAAVADPTFVYTGKIHGKPDLETLRVIRHWKENRLRCPVIVQAWRYEKIGGVNVPVELLVDNMWRHNEAKKELTIKVPDEKGKLVTKDRPDARIYVRDFSGYYNIPPEYFVPEKNLIVLGYYDPAIVGGPNSVPPNHTRPVSEILPENLIGKPLTALTDAERSTYKVVRAISEIECNGFFDSINAYDDAFISLGPCHWTLSIKGAEGELPAYLAYLKKSDEEAFKKAIRFWGIETPDWGADGKPLFKSQRKYEAKIKQQKENGEFEDVPTHIPTVNYFRTWHWFYRFQAATRSIDGFRRRMWDMTRIRIRDILSTPWKDGVFPAGSPTLTLGDVFTSELAVALLLRWHVFAPGDIVQGHKSADDIVQALMFAGIKPAAGLPDRWAECEQHQLFQGISLQVAKRIQDAKKSGKTNEAARYVRLKEKLREVVNFPLWKTGKKPGFYQLDHKIGVLDRKSKSFKFDSAGLSEAPHGDPETEFAETDNLDVAATDLLDAAEDAAIEKRILQAFAGDKLVFEAFSNAITIHGEWRNIGNANSDDVRKQIDRLVFFNANENHEEALWMLPVINGELGKLRVRNEGGTDARLEIEGKYRAFAFISGSESLGFDIEINHQNTGVNRRLYFKKLEAGIDEKNNFLLEELSSRKFSRDVKRGFEASQLLDKLGLKCGPIEDTYQLAQTLSFVPNSKFKERSGEYPKFVMDIFTEIGLTSSDEPNQKIIPFAVEAFKWNEMPLKREANGTDFWHYVEVVQKQPHTTKWVDSVETGVHWLVEVTLPHRAALDAWNRTVELPVRQALRTIQGGRPVTLIPAFENLDQPRQVWLARFSVIDNTKKENFRLSEIKFPNEINGKPPAGELLVFGRLLSPRKPGNENRGLRVQARFERFLTVSGEPLVCRFEIKAPEESFEPETEAVEIDRDGKFKGVKSPGFYFQGQQIFPASGTAVSSFQTARVGSLNLEFYPANALDGAVDLETENLSLFRAAFDYDENKSLNITQRAATFRLAATRISPGGQDSIPGEEFFTDLGDDIDAGEEYRRRFLRDRALIINLDKKNEQTEIGDKPPFFLNLQERIEPHKSQTIALQLKSNADEGNSVSDRSASAEVIIIDPHPFLICKVRISEFQEALAAGVTNELGNWTNRADASGAGWEVSAGAEGFNLILPPQTIGEAMHRSKNAGDVKAGEAIDFRFSPPAQIRLRPSFYRQRFAEVPWNLRRILGYVGQRASGAGVERMDFEMLYGLPGTVTYPYLRLAEIGSRLGANPGQQFLRLSWRHSQNQQNQYESFRSFWKTLYPSLLSRLAILEPWNANQPQTLILNETEGVSFALRKSADLRYPIRNIEVPPDGFNGFKFSENGLPGGYSWGFESHNVFQALLRAPVSHSAQITRPLFSSLGGWIQQRVAFDGGLTTIASETVMGRVSSVNIERIGRINVFWNRAKHVIVYERTVAPSRQFAAEQEPLVGNPVLRKVDEYIELLEDERPFPDYESMSKLSRGCVLGCRFPSGKPPRIRVNSNWGGEIGKIGWKVPLWMRGAAPADVYPKPNIALMMAGKNAGQIVPVALDEPEKLYFYTLTDPNSGSNPEEWGAVEGLDFNLVSFSAPQPGDVEGDPNQVSKEDSPVRDGSGAFTFALAPAPQPINVMADRVSESITARLQNVTVMRGFAPVQPMPDDVRDILALRDGLTNNLVPILTNLTVEKQKNDSADFADGSVEADFSALSNLGEFINNVKSGIEKTKAQLKKAHDHLVGSGDFEQKLAEEIRTRLEQQFKFTETQIRFEVEAALTNFSESFAETVALGQIDFPDNFAAAKEFLQQQLTALADGTGEISETRRMLRTLRGSKGEFQAALEKSRERLANTAHTAKARIEDFKCDVCRVENWGKAAKPQVEAILRRARRDLEDTLAQTDFMIAEIPRRWISNRTDNIRSLPEIRKKRGEIENLLRELYFLSAQLDAPEGAREKVNKKLDDLIGEISNFVDQNEAKISEIWQHALDNLSDVPFEDLLDEFRNKLADLIGNSTDWQDFQSRIKNISEQFFAQLSDQIKPKLKALENSLGAQAEALREAFLPTLGELKKAMDDALDAGKVEAKLRQVVAPTTEQMREELEGIYGRLLGNVNEYVNRAAVTIPIFPAVPAISKDNALRLIRGFGEPPKLPQLSFPKDAIGYYFVDLLNKKELTEIGLTPVVAQVGGVLQNAANQARDLLNPLAINLPTNALLDRFKPIDLSKFDLSKVFPSFAGLKLDGLFSNLRMPELSSDRVKVTHGINPETRSGWVQVNVDVPFQEQPLTVFALAGVSLRLLKARFQGESRIEFVEGQPPRQLVRGVITGDWDLQVGGMPIAVFVNCSLAFEDGGKIRFDVSPDRVRLQQILSFLTDLLSKLGYSDEGFSVAVTPTGVRSILNLPLPDVQAGAFGIANLNLGLIFTLEIVGEFGLRAQLSVGRRDAPFTLTVFVLGGAGYFELDVGYKPRTGAITAKVSIGIFAAASLAIALGPIKGGIYAYFGITVDYAVSNQAPSSLTIGLLLLFRGEVRLLGIVTVSLTLALEAQYTKGGGLVGRGRVSLKIKICWCVTIKVNAQIEYRFGKSAGQADFAEALFRDDAAALPEAGLTYQEAAENYIGMFA